MNEHYVIIFDGVCNLCNWYVRFVIRHDRRARFMFSPFQSDFSRNILRRHQIESIAPKTVILVCNSKVYVRSLAILEVVKNLGGPWKLLYIFKIIPAFIRDPFYDIIARNRYRWFGRKNECMIPDEKIRSRFLN